LDRIGQYVHTHTLYNEYRPFGTAAIVASYDEFDKYSLYMVEPSGQYLVHLTSVKIYFKGYYGVANGRGKNSVKGYLDKTDFKNLSCREALFHIAKV
jgi:20S proteasome alpha/beta subunit